MDVVVMVFKKPGNAGLDLPLWMEGLVMRLFIRDKLSNYLYKSCLTRFGFSYIIMLLNIVFCIFFFTLKTLKHPVLIVVKVHAGLHA